MMCWMLLKGRGDISDVSEFSSGLYFYSLSIDERVVGVKKMVFVK